MSGCEWSDLETDPAQRLAEVFTAAGLTLRETAVIGWRLLGLSLAETAERVGLGSKQLAAYHERKALARLDLPPDTIERIVRGSGRAEVRGQGGEYFGDCTVRPACTTRRKERWERDHERAVAAFLASA